MSIRKGEGIKVSGSASGLYNISNTIEGFDSYKLAENGDVYSIAFNPIRDTVFQGNQKVYDRFGAVSSIVLSVKVIGAVSPDASVAYEFGKGIVIDKTYEFGKVNAIKLYESKTGNKLNETQKAAIQGIWDIGNTAKSLHDAKTFRNQRPSLLGNIEGGEGNRYLDFLKNGSNSGLTQVEIYGVVKVDSYTAEIEVGKIRHNTVEQNINSSMLGNIETSYGKSSGSLTYQSGSGSKPYTNSRPSYGKNQVNEVWENAKDPITGKVYDPSGIEITWDKTKPRNGQWDKGHIPGEKYSEMHQLYMDDVISKDEFLEWYRNPKNYRPELPSTNRSHKYE